MHTTYSLIWFIPIQDDDPYRGRIDGLLQLAVPFMVAVVRIITDFGHVALQDRTVPPDYALEVP
jgi:hypothetical protein